MSDQLTVRRMPKVFDEFASTLRLQLAWPSPWAKWQQLRSGLFPSYPEQRQGRLWFGGIVQENALTGDAVGRAKVSQYRIGKCGETGCWPSCVGPLKGSMVVRFLFALDTHELGKIEAVGHEREGLFQRTPILHAMHPILAHVKISKTCRGANEFLKIRMTPKVTSLGVRSRQWHQVDSAVQKLGWQNVPNQLLVFEDASMLGGCGWGVTTDLAKCTGAQPAPVLAVLESSHRIIENFILDSWGRDHSTDLWAPSSHAGVLQRCLISEPGLRRTPSILLWHDLLLAHDAWAARPPMHPKVARPWPLQSKHRPSENRWAKSSKDFGPLPWDASLRVAASSCGVVHHHELEHEVPTHPVPPVHTCHRCCHPHQRRYHLQWQGHTW